MAIRFRFQQQPGLTPLGQAFGNLANAFISGPSQFEVDKMAAEGDLARLRGDEYRRKFGAYDAMAKVFEPGTDGTIPFDPAKQARVISEAARGGLDPDKAGGYSRIYAVTANAPQPVQDRSVYAVAPWSNTKSAFDESQKTEITKAGIGAGATIQAAQIHEAGAMDRTKVEYVDPTDGKIKIGTVKQVREGGYTPVLQHGQMGVTPIEGQPGKFQYQPYQPGLPAPVPSSEKDRFVLTLDPGTGRNAYQPVVPGLPGPMSSGEAGGVRMQKIADAMKQFGLSQADATAVVDGHKKVQMDPGGGRLYLIDNVTGTAQEVPVKPAPLGPRVQPGPAPTSGPIQGRMADTTGVLPGVLEHITGTVGQAIPSLASPEVTANRQALGIINELAVDALLKNPRASVAEQERIRKLLPTTGVFTSATEATTKLLELRELTLRRIESDQALLNAPVPYGREARQQAEERIRKADLLLREIDRFAGGGSAAAPAPRPSVGPMPPAGGDDPMSQARDAIRRGANPEQVKQRLRQLGLDPSGL